MLGYAALACYLEHNSCKADLSKDGSTLAIITFYGQTLALLASDNFYGITTLANMEINSVGSNDGKHCITAMPPFTATCVGMLLVPAFLCGVAWLRSRQNVADLPVLDDEQSTTANSADSDRRAKRAILEGLMFSYFGMTKKAIGLLSCIRVGNQRLVTIDKSHECHDS